MSVNVIEDKVNILCEVKTMLKKYHVEKIISDALMELDSQVSEPDCETGKWTLYGASIEKDENGDMIFTFKEDVDSDDKPDRYRIRIEYM